jgi:hypothetical protein
MHKSEHLHQYYLKITRRDNPRHWAVLQLQDEVRVQPVKIVQQVWENNTIFFLRRALIRIVNNWERLCPETSPYPVSFSNQDFALYNYKLEKREFVSDTLNLIQKNYGLNPDGTVDPDKYDEIQTELMRLKNIYLEATDNEEERFNVEKLWPYQDSVVIRSTFILSSNFTLLCRDTIPTPQSHCATKTWLTSSSVVSSATLENTEPATVKSTCGNETESRRPRRGLAWLCEEIQGSFNCCLQTDRTD